MAQEPKSLSTRAFVRVRRARNSWVNWNHRLDGGPTMTIRPGRVELSAPQGTMLESRNIALSADSSTIRRDSVGWAGTPFGRRQCIRITGSDDRGTVDVAVTPEVGLEVAWQALTDAGFEGRSKQP